MKKIVVIGAGMGGLTAATRLAQLGHRVTLLEARDVPGGLASGFDQSGFHFDAGPYILLDLPGLQWAFQALGIDVQQRVELRRIEHVYSVADQTGPVVHFYADVQQTAAAMEQQWPGSGARYVKFVDSASAIYQRLKPMLTMPEPGLGGLLRTGAWRHVTFLLRSLQSILAGAGLPAAVVNAMGIWTHVAGQRMSTAPAPMAFVPGLIHGVGSYYPVGGIGRLPQIVAAIAESSGVEFRYRTKARSIRCKDDHVTGVETHSGEYIECDAVVANCGGVGAYVELLPSLPRAIKEEMARLPLQSPGICAYLAVRGNIAPPYLRFSLSGKEDGCRLIIAPTVMEPELMRDGWHPARLLMPLDHGRATAMGEAGQRATLERLLAEKWWQEGATDFRVLESRIPAQWGVDFHLYNNSMNPVMTAAFMRAGRLAHRSPYVKGLYLAGSATHPGQWVSFCSISGVLSAQALHKDLS
ncbi:MAG TPA: FAD-dependent oxidoreductase [Candidatus Angelobacter sp.]|nr:FAD-dependent oxidoreductase [Candidatus Angelobacter sp.]